MLREPLNGLTHCIGAILAILGLIVLLVRVSAPIQPWHMTAFAIYGAGMIFLYTASTLYHWLPLSPAGVRVLRRIDHAMIFIYIAASYTPICLVPLRGPWGWSLVSVIWAAALAGLFLSIFWIDAPRWLTTGLYLGMGWAALAAFYPLASVLPLAAIVWLVLGGVFYSAGAVIYARRRPNFGVFGFHELFHLFVIAGSVCHFWMMYYYIAKI